MSEPASVECGVFLGTCTNHVTGVSARLVLVLRRVDPAAGEIDGLAGLYGGLYGGSVFTGTVRGPSLCFATKIPSEPDALWNGVYDRGAITGSYSAPNRGWRRWVLGDEYGSWECRFAAPLLDHRGGIEKVVVYVRAAGRTDGPLHLTQFADLLAQSHWGADATVSMDGGNGWLPIGLLVDALRSSVPELAGTGFWASISGASKTGLKELLVSAIWKAAGL